MTNASQLRVTENRNWGGNQLSHIPYAAIMRDQRPHDFGEITSRMFSSNVANDIIDARWHYYTEAVGNVHVLPGGTDTFKWSLGTDNTILYTVTEQIETDVNGQYGRDGSTFRIALNVGYLEQPVTIKPDSNNLPLGEIVGRGQPGAKAGSFIYLIRLQTGNPDDYWPLSAFSLNSRFNREGSIVSDEMNQKFGTTEFSNGSTLFGHVGQVGNKFEFTDKVVRAELAKGQKTKYKIGGRDILNAFSNYRVVYGLTTVRDNKTRKAIDCGMMITHAEYAVAEQCIKDRESIMEYGRNMVRPDDDSGFNIKVAPGWRQIVKDGHYWRHSGNITLRQIEDYFHAKFFQKKSYKNRHVVLDCGNGAINMLSDLFQEQAGFYQHPDANFYIRERKGKGSGIHKYELEGGSQFTAWFLRNGISVELRYNAAKDDPVKNREYLPNTQIPLESYAIDIYDLGDTEDTDPNATNKKNVTMVKQDGVDSYYITSSVIDLRKGVMKKGETVANHSKQAGIYMELSGSLVVWDVSRVGRIELVMPN